MGQLNTEKRLPPSLRDSVFESYLLAIENEIINYREQIARNKESLNNIDVMTEFRIKQISELYQIPINTLVKGDIQFLKNELRATAFKLVNKGTPKLYYSFFGAIDRVGVIFSYTHVAVGYMLSPAKKKPLEIPDVKPNSIFKVEREKVFSGLVDDILTLDTDPLLYLDADPLWYLDTKSFKVTSNHIGVEYYLDRLIKREDSVISKITQKPIKLENEYLMTKEYLYYLEENMTFSRRVKEVDHIGSQLSIKFTKEDGDTYQSCNIEDLKIKGRLCKNLAKRINKTVKGFSYIEWGVGSLDFNNTMFGSASNPKWHVAQPISLNPLKDIYQYEANNEYSIANTYEGQSCLNQEVEIPSSSISSNTTQEFNLKHRGIQPKSTVIEIWNKSEPNKKYKTKDDGKGNFYSPYLSGTINYETGECFITSKFSYETDHVFDKFNFSNDNKELSTFLEKIDNIPLTKGTLTLTFINQNGLVTKVTDNGNGEFIAPGIESGIINYETGHLVIKWDYSLDIDTYATKIHYAYKVDYDLPQEKVINSSYRITSLVKITEVGLLNNKKELIGYLTFPPIEHPSDKFHLALTLILSQD